MKYICVEVESKVASNGKPYSKLTYQAEGSVLDTFHTVDFCENRRHIVGEVIHMRTVEYKLSQPMRYVNDRKRTPRNSIILHCPIVFDEQQNKWVDVEDINALVQHHLNCMTPTH